MKSTEAWIALDLIPGIGPKTIQKLLEIYHTPADILSAPPSQFNNLSFLNAAQKTALVAGVDEKALANVMETLESHGGHALCLDDPAYPEMLRHIADPPSVLYIKGDLHDLQPAVAIVGTRSPSHYGKDTALRLGRDLSTMGISVVSGLARGIDTHAHQGALQGIAKTVGVLGSGIDAIYPPENKALAEAIAQQGAIVSEFPPGTHPDPKNFPRRNRIISALSTGVIVIEAAYKSGALITARYAGEQGKCLMAIPGAVTNIRSQGPHHLIRQGAVLVRDAADVIMEIAPQVKGFISDTEKHGEDRDDIVRACSGQALSIDDIAHELHMTVSEVTQRISMLELSGEIIKVDGNRFIARSGNG
ncbi:MAG TPA: DNA-processing protein DprA [Deltaproteobacteria bacterium]|nr:DNA-processing protein DprA [Deltaproteobacteria bacterium]HPR52161.1 DNA-processing protein DprA [Deltaproteobacteria bacterium]